MRSKEELAVAQHKCPVCDVNPGHLCLNQNATRAIRALKHPHLERVRMVDPTARWGYKANEYRIGGRTRRIAGEDWKQSDDRNKNARQK